MIAPSAPVPKHQQVYAALRADILAGRWKQGERMPSEAELVRAHGASRITVGRAMRDLQHAGLVERRAGSGSYVKTPLAKGALSFGLLIPDLGQTAIFESICQGMTSSPLAREHALLWGSAHGVEPSTEEWAWQLCRQYVARRVSGVFFAPLEPTSAGADVNQRIADALDDAKIALVLLDRTVAPYPRRGRHDLVGIDNRRAGFVMTDHLLKQGRRRLAFVAVPGGASTVAARRAGFYEAMFAADLPMDKSAAHDLDPANPDAVRALMRSSRPDGIVCANDLTAARLMQTLLGLDIAIPRDVGLVGIDDADYAALLPVPLTTLRQPTREIGDAAMSAMLERVARKNMPARDILLQCQLVVRKSSGAE